MPVLYDSRGNPVSTADLRRSHAGPKVASIRTVDRVPVASSLSPERLAGLLRGADAGQTESFFTLAEEMEERELHYRSVLGTRKLGVTGSPVQVEAASDDAKDQEIADEVRELVEDPAFEGLATDLLDALGKGVSVVEIQWETSASQWRPTGYEWRDPRWFLWDLDTRSRPLLRTDANPMGEELAPFKYAVHIPRLKSGLPLRGGLARVACTAYMLKSYTVRDWMAFMEVFGMPIRLGKYGPDATDDDRKELLRALTNIGTDAAAAIPASMLIEFVETTKAAGGDKLFQGAADWLDRQVSKVVLGQTMTTDDGSSRAQAQVHDGVRLDLRQADARQVSATINRDVIGPFVALNWGPDITPPKVRIVVEEPEDLKAYSDTVTAFIDRGLEVEQSVVRDKLGIPDPEPGAVLLGAKAQPQPQPPGGAGGAPGDAAPKQQPPSEPGQDGEPPEPGLNRRVENLERAVLVALNRMASQDAIDELVDQTLGGEWKPLLEPNVGDLVAELEKSVNVADARRILAHAAERMDVSRLVDSLAVAMTKMRGLGDATDKVT